MSSGFPCVANTCEEARAVLDRWEQLGKRRRPPPKKEAALAGGTQSNNTSQLVARPIGKSKEIHLALVALSAGELVEWLEIEVLGGLGKELK